jgi:hypothetical protein
LSPSSSRKSPKAGILAVPPDVSMASDVNLAKGESC